MTVLARTSSDLSDRPTARKEQKFGYESRQDPKPRITVLARVSSNLLLCCSTLEKSSNKLQLCSERVAERPTPLLVEEEAPISKHIRGLGTNKNMAMSPDAA
jgi:hypothetical protein